VASGRDYDDAGVPDNTSNDYNISIPTFYAALGRVGYHVMTVGKDDLSKATQCGTKTHQGDWRGFYHQAELGFADGLRSGGKLDVISTPKIPHERYGHWLAEQPPLTLQNGSKISAWEAHVQCMAGAFCSTESFPDELYGDDFVTHNAIHMLRNRTMKEKPWFLQVNFPGPHPPFLVTPRQHGVIDGRVFPPPVDNPKHIDPQICKRITKPSPSTIDRCSYAAECEHLDALFGAILDELDNLGERNNTIICFSSDHGEMLGDHGLVGKTVPWQGSASIPLICSGPSILSGQVIHRPVSTKDLGATFLDYAINALPDVRDSWLPPPASSRSLRSLLETGKDDDYHSIWPFGLAGGR
jgi:arylsulfatase A-like enzyme